MDNLGQPSDNVYIRGMGKLLANRLNAGILFCESLEPVVAQRFHERELRKQGHEIPEQVCYLFARSGRILIFYAERLHSVDYAVLPSEQALVSKQGRP